MVSIPSFLSMATKDWTTEVHALKTLKGHLSSYMTMIWPLCERVGELPCPPEAIGGPKSTKWGEVIYVNAIVIAMAAKNLELLTNELREADGRKPLNYSESNANVILKDHEKLFNETAKDLGFELTADGKLVRS